MLKSTLSDCSLSVANVVDSVQAAERDAWQKVRHYWWTRFCRQKPQAWQEERQRPFGRSGYSRPGHALKGAE